MYSARIHGSMQMVNTLKGYNFSDFISKCDKLGNSISLHCGRALVVPMRLENGEFVNSLKADATHCKVNLQFIKNTYLLSQN